MLIVVKKGSNPKLYLLRKSAFSVPEALIYIMDWLLKSSWLLMLLSSLNINAERPRRSWMQTKLDCLWEWSEWSAPYGFGDRKREQIVYRYPANGGLPCPSNDTQVIKPAVPTLPTVAEVAEEVITNFLNPVTKKQRRKRESKNHRTEREATTNKRDILFILDSSGSIGSSTFTKMKSDLAQLIELICPNTHPNGPFDSNIHRAALLKYSSSVHTGFNFNTYKTTSEIKNAIIAETYLGRGTCTNLAFNEALGMFDAQKGSRSDVNHEVLIITDGQSNCGSPAIPVQRLKDKGIKVFALAVGISGASGRSEIESYVSLPLDEHLFALSDYRELDELVQMVKSKVGNGLVKCAPLNTG